MSRFRARAPVVALVGAALVLPSDIRAEDDPLADALQKLAAWSARFENMMHRAAFTMSGYTVEVASDGTTSARKEAVLRIDHRGRPRAHVEVVRYTEDGEDKTAEAGDKARKEERKRESEPLNPDEEIHLPFLATEIPKYSFRAGEIDPRVPTRVRVHFAARHPARNLGVGSAWVDVKTGDVLSMGVSPSKTSLFVDYMNVTLEFGEQTPLGPAISRMGVDMRGGFWFFAKRVRGTSRLFDYDVR